MGTYFVIAFPKQFILHVCRLVLQNTVEPCNVNTNMFGRGVHIIEVLCTL